MRSVGGFGQLAGYVKMDDEEICFLLLDCGGQIWLHHARWKFYTRVVKSPWEHWNIQIRNASREINIISAFV